MPNVPDEWIKTALRVTGHFEDSSDPLGAVTGDFDGMGISLGVLQWNIGSHSLQAMVAALGETAVKQLMPHYGDQLWDACNGDVPHGLAICRSWQNGSQLRPDALQELKAFTKSDLFVAQQVHKVSGVAAQAWSAAADYASEDPQYGEVSKPLFCWFFDVFTQNGGLKGIGYADVSAFIEKNAGNGAVRVICDWLSSRPKGMAGYRDSNANGIFWRSSVPQSATSLLVLSYLRSQLSRPEYRADVMNRKGTVAVQQGRVHGEMHDLRELLRD